MSENQRNNAIIKAETLIENAMGEVKSLKDSKVIEINNLKTTVGITTENSVEIARTHSSQYLKNTSR